MSLQVELVAGQGGVDPRLMDKGEEVTVEARASASALACRAVCA